MLLALAAQAARRDAEGARRMQDAYVASTEGCKLGSSGKTLVRFGPAASVASGSRSSTAATRARAAKLAGAFAASFGGGGGSPRVFARSGGVAATLNASMLDLAINDPDVRPPSLSLRRARRTAARGAAYPRQPPPSLLPLTLPP